MVRKRTDISPEELERMMAEYGALKARSVRSARVYLRSIGMNVNSRGHVVVRDQACRAVSNVVRASKESVHVARLDKAVKSKNPVLVMRAMRASGGKSGKNFR